MNDKGRGHPLLVSVSITLAMMMQVLDLTIANVALPHMRGGLSATLDQIAWVLTSYIVASAIATLPVGFLANRLGRRNLLLWSIVGFTVASVLCGQAHSLNEMVVWRAVQGASGAALVPLSQATLFDTFPREKHATAMAYWSMAIMLGPILGPTLGGWLTEYYSWRWVFYINVPVGIFSAIGVYLFLPDTPLKKDRFDALGFGLLALSVAALQLLLDRGQQVDWFDALETRLYCVAIALGLYLFVVHSRTGERKFLSPGLFQDRNFLSGFIFILVVHAILLSTLTLLPPFLQQWKEYPAVTVGLILMPRGAGTVVGMLLVSRLVRFVDPRIIILAGLVLISLTLFQMAGFNLQVEQAELVSTGTVQGIGLGLVIVPTVTLPFATLPHHLRNEGTALFSLVRNLGSSIGVSVFIAVLTRSMWINQQEIGARLQLPPRLWYQLSSPEDLLSAPAAVIREVARQAAEIAYVNDFYLLAWVTLAAMPLVLLLRNPGINEPVPVEA